MKLADWLNAPNPDGSRKSRSHFAAAIGVTPQMISAYCSEDRPTVPKPERLRAIARETNNEVTPNDFLEVAQ